MNNEAMLKKVMALKDHGASPVAFIVDGVVKVSGEEGDWAHYYGPKGYPWIHPKLEAFAEANGCFWEWQDPGCINLYEV